jgi:hypothetical protein
MAKSCIIVGPGDVDLGAVHQRPVGVGHVVGEVGRHEAVAEEVQVAGGRVDLGMGGHRRGERPSKSWGPPSRGRRATARRAGRPRPELSRRPACSNTLTLLWFRAPPGGRPAHRAARNPRGGGVSRKRLRYQAALPPPRRTPWTMPSPRNQCDESPDAGFEPLRTYSPASAAGSAPRTGRSNASTLLGDRREPALHPVGAGGVERRESSGPTPPAASAASPARWMNARRSIDAWRAACPGTPMAQA